jgi:hypothetical protein
MTDTTPHEQSFPAPLVWRTRSIDLIFEIWGTASSNVAESNLNDLELDLRARIRPMLGQLPSLQDALPLLFLEDEGSCLRRQDVAIDTLSRRRDPCCILIDTRQSGSRIVLLLVSLLLTFS